MVKREKNGKVTFTYRGSLEEEIGHCKAEQEKRSASGELQKLEWLHDRAKRELDAYMKRDADLSDFIRCAEEELEKRKAETK